MPRLFTRKRRSDAGTEHRVGLRTKVVAVASIAAVSMSIVAASGGAIASPSPSRGGGGKSVVQVDSGSLRGVRADGAQQFLGVPYAAPPVRELRFAPPAAPAAWEGVRDADTQSPACLQFQPSGVKEEQTLSEDCLYLDVYRPEKVSRGTKLPVMVWFHGGGNTQGTGVIYGGSSMAAKTGAIVVTINYRLGALGFLAHPALSAETPGGSGNYGVMDQIQSLKWVQENIAAFGGDTENVTVYGQSAGAAGVCSMLTSPWAAGLFDKAILQSSSCVRDRVTLATAEPTGVAFATAVGCTDPATVTSCLRKAWPGTLVANQALYTGGPKVGGEILPVQPTVAIPSGQWNAVPIMTGSTKSENRLLSTALAGITAERYVERVRSTYGAKADRVLELYPLADYKTPYDAITQVQTDAGTACTTEVSARAFDALVPTYRYEFDDPTSPTLYGFAVPGEDMSNGHSAELAYLFDFTLGEKPLTAEQEVLSDQMMRYWGSFAWNDDPNFDGAPEWPTYGAEHQVMQLRTAGESAVITSLDDDHNCAFWLS